MLREIKDKALSRCIAFAFNSRLKKFGKIIHLELESQKRSIEMEILLKGEREPLRAEITRYDILKEEGKYFLTIRKIVTSREWINLLAEEYLEGERIELPEHYGKMLMMLA